MKNSEKILHCLSTGYMVCEKHFTPVCQKRLKCVPYIYVGGGKNKLRINKDGDK
jgi:hypothetical protein